MTIWLTSGDTIGSSRRSHVRFWQKFVHSESWVWCWGRGRVRVLYQSVSAIWPPKPAAAVVCTKCVVQQEKP